MRKTVKDWKRDWIKANGETHDFEVALEYRNATASDPYVYEGSFVDIPEDLMDKKVIEWARIIDSSEQERIGAYVLII